MSNDFQTKINQMSLVMTIPEDIVKACKIAGFPPQMVDIFLRIHDQQIQLEKAVNELRSTQLQMARVIEMQANMSTHISTTINNMAKNIGYTGEEPIKAEEIKS